MPEREQVLVTGATGNVGREVLGTLSAAGQPVVAAVRGKHGASRLPAEVETRIFDFERPETYPAALAGVGKLFLMRPPRITDVSQYLFPAIDYAATAGVRHIVFLSLLGVEENKRVPHYQVERYLEASGVPHTFMRPSFYMQNLNTTHRREIREEDRIAVPAGEAKTSFVDVRDVGAATARVLSEPGHENRSYALTGGEALDYGEVAALFTAVLDREITYTDPSLWRFVYRSLARGRKLSFTLVMAFLYFQTRRGMAERVTDDVERLLGRPPIPMRRYIEDYVACWTR